MCIKAEETLRLHGTHQMSSKRTEHKNSKAVCSVSEMAQLLGFSRSRFYQLLQKQNVFPQPLYDIATKRPFYPQHLQERCLQIRNTGVGDNHQQILFYGRRKKGPPAGTVAGNDRYDVLISAFRQQRIPITLKQLKAALKELYPEGLPKRIDDNSVIQNLISHWDQRQSK